MKIQKDYNVVDINNKRRFNKNEPFILAAQVTQVNYASYPSMKHDKDNWWVVCRIKRRRLMIDIYDSVIEDEIELDYKIEDKSEDDEAEYISNDNEL